MDTTANYRMHGALLSVGQADAALLVGRNLARPDPMGDMPGFKGMFVPGDKIDRHILGEETMLRLVGGVTVARNEVADTVVTIQPIDIDGVFDEETT
jgi:hypothetical protein